MARDVRFQPIVGGVLEPFDATDESLQNQVASIPNRDSDVDALAGQMQVTSFYQRTVVLIKTDDTQVKWSCPVQNFGDPLLKDVLAECAKHYHLEPSQFQHAYSGSESESDRTIWGLDEKLSAVDDDDTHLYFSAKVM